MNDTPLSLIDFELVATTALANADSIIQRWVPDGRRQGHEWVGRNPHRADRHSGSFKINLVTGRWGDFATRDVGGDLVSLAAYLFNLSQREAAMNVAEMIGIDPYVK